MKKMNNKYSWLLLIIAFCSCKKPYQPAEVSTDYNYLVVEGVINPGTDSTFIKLSRTVKLNSKTSTKTELKAILNVENEQGASFALKETTNGNYTAAGLNLDNSKKYRLRIKTSNGKTYLSDFVEVKNAPPVDSVGYVIGSDGLNIYNNAHDATGNTRYYRWDFQETWQFTAEYYATFITDGKQLQTRTADQQIYTCWGNDVSANIVLGSSTKLTQDLIYQNPLTNISAGSEKLFIRYSILVKQYALTKDAYTFWGLMKTNTEQLGSIFDAQPSQSLGNIHNIADPLEPVIGYLSVGIVQSKRIFIDGSNLPAVWQRNRFGQCTIDTAYFSNPLTKSNDVQLTLIPKPPSAFALNLVRDDKSIIGYQRTTPTCADCTLRGVNKQPSFWK